MCTCTPQVRDELKLTREELTHPSYHPLASPFLSSLAGALVGEPALRELLPLAAPLLLDAQEPLLADGCGSALAEDILCSRGHVAAELVRSGIA